MVLRHHHHRHHHHRAARAGFWNLRRGRYWSSGDPRTNGCRLVVIGVILAIPGLVLIAVGAVTGGFLGVSVYVIAGPIFFIFAFCFLVAGTVLCCVSQGKCGCCGYPAPTTTTEETTAAPPRDNQVQPAQQAQPPPPQQTQQPPPYAAAANQGAYPPPQQMYPPPYPGNDPAYPPPSYKA